MQITPYILEDDSTNLTHIVIENPVDISTATDSRYLYYNSFYFGGLKAKTGSIIVSNPISINSSSCGIRVENINDSCTVRVSDPVVIDCNQSSSASDYASSIVIQSTAAGMGTSVMNGPEILNPKFVVNGATSPKHLIFISDSGNTGINGTRIINPSGDSLSTGDMFAMTGTKIDDLTLVDPQEVFAYTENDIVDATQALAHGALFSVFRSPVLGFDNTVSWDQYYPIGAEIKFVVYNTDSKKIIIDPYANDRIYPIGTGNGKYIFSLGCGNSTTLKKISDGKWIQTSVVGTWTAEA
jgi:hypothetical protein